MALTDGSSERNDAPVEIPSAGPLKVSSEAPDTDEIDDGSDGDVDQAAAQQAGKQPGPGRPGTRKERRNLHQEMTRLRDENAKIPGMIQKMQQDFQQQLAAIAQQGQRGAAPSGQPGQGGGNPVTARFDQAIRGIEAEMQREMKLMRTWDEEKQGPFDSSRYLRLQDAKMEAIADRRDAVRQAQQPRPQAAQQGADDGAQAHRFNALADEFPWLRGEDKVLRMAVGREYRELVGAGRPESLAVHREACAKVAAMYRLGGSQPSRPGRGAPPDGARGGGGGAPEEVEVPPEMLRGLGLSQEQIRQSLFGKR